MRNTLRSVLTAVLGVGLAAACSGPADTPQPPSQGASAADSPPMVQAPISINAQMVRLVDHAGHHLWNAEKPEMTPKTEADWADIVEHASQMAAAGALMRLEGPGPNDRTFVRDPEWHTFARAVTTAGLAALRAGETKNLEALVTANGQLVEACEGCHKQFKPSLPSEGIVHTHAH